MAAGVKAANRGARLRCAAAASRRRALSELLLEGAAAPQRQWPGRQGRAGGVGWQMGGC